MDNQQPKVSAEDFGWLAGMFDGEGTVALSIRHTKQGFKIQPLMSISGTDVSGLNRTTAILDAAELPYHVGWMQPKGHMKNGSPYKAAWNVLAAGHRRCLRWATWLTPGLTIKRKRAELLLDFLQSRAGGPRQAPVSEAQLALVVEMRGLNAKGHPLGAMTLPSRAALTTEQRHVRAENGRKGAARRWAAETRLNDYTLTP